MPELPDLVHVEAELRRLVVGRRIETARTGDPLVLRIMTPAPFPEVLVGRRIEEATRRGQYILLGLDGGLVLVVNCMLAGRFVFAPPSEGNERKMGAAVALALGIEGGGELRYVDDKRMGKVYVAPVEALGTIPQFKDLGIEVLSDAFTAERFRALVAKRRDQVRQFLMDKTALASIGNAYADEILWAAGIHPKTFCRKLTPDDVERLYQAILRVLREAIAEIQKRGESLDVKVRDFLSVRGRAGKPCPRCGTTIRAVRVGDGDACFCPKCQPSTRPLFVDWGKLPGGGGTS